MLHGASWNRYQARLSLVCGLALSAGCGKTDRQSVHFDAAAGSATIAETGGETGGAVAVGGSAAGGFPASGGGGDGGLSGEAPLAGGGGEAPQDRCVDGAVRCLAEVGLRERCLDQEWVQEEFVCAVSVRVENQSGFPCAVKANGDFNCWSLFYQRPTAPSGHVREVHAGQYTWEGTKFLTDDGSLWTHDSRGLTELATSVASFDQDGTRGWCAVTDDGSPHCEQILALADLAANEPVTQLVLSLEDTCALTQSGKAVCRVAQLTGQYSRLAMGSYETCGLRTDGELHCANNWNAPLDYELPPGPFTTLAMADETVCALRTSGEIVCAGFQAPEPPSGAYTQIDGGDRTLCAINVDGSVHCFSSFGGALEVPSGW